MMQVTRYVLYDIIKNRIILAYALFLFLVSFGLFQMENEGSKAILSLLTIVLLVTPLISMVFTTIHYYNSYEFMELMLSQPLGRTRILLSEYAGAAISLLTAFLMGVGVPILLFAPNAAGFALLFTGAALTLIFTSIAFLAAVCSRDKARGIGIALLIWFYFAMLYDGLLLLLLNSFSDYPMEKFTLLLSSLNPIDLGRIFIMLQLDISALMGYTGAVYKDFFGSASGMLFTTGIMLLWMAIPLWLALRLFRKKDL
jgi:Cu-processing system permease protein